MAELNFSGFITITYETYTVLLQVDQSLYTKLSSRPLPTNFFIYNFLRLFVLFCATPPPRGLRRGYEHTPKSRTLPWMQPLHGDSAAYRELECSATKTVESPRLLMTERRNEPEGYDCNSRALKCAVICGYEGQRSET